MDCLDKLENYFRVINELDNKIKYLKNLIDIIIFDVDIRGNKLTFENTISTTEDILEYIRLKEIQKNKLLIYNKIKNKIFIEKMDFDSFFINDNNIIEINKYINKLNNRDQFCINKLLLINENIIYYDFLVKYDKEFINKNFDRNNCPIKTQNKRKIRIYMPSVNDIYDSE